MGETGDPCGIPLSTGCMSPHRPSMQIAASLFDRKLAVHFTYSSGIFFLLSSLRRRPWLTKSKYPLMSKVRAEVTLPAFQAVCTSVMNVSMASSVEELERPPNCVGGTRLSSPARNVRRLATMRSSIFPRHSRRVINL